MSVVGFYRLNTFMEKSGKRVFELKNGSKSGRIFHKRGIQGATSSDYTHLGNNWAETRRELVGDICGSGFSGKLCSGLGWCLAGFGDSGD